MPQHILSPKASLLSWPSEQTDKPPPTCARSTNSDIDGLSTSFQDMVRLSVADATCPGLDERPPRTPDAVVQQKSAQFQIKTKNHISSASIETAVCLDCACDALLFGFECEGAKGTCKRAAGKRPEAVPATDEQLVCGPRIPHSLFLADKLRWWRYDCVCRGSYFSHTSLAMWFLSIEIMLSMPECVIPIVWRLKLASMLCKGLYGSY